MTKEWWEDEYMPINHEHDHINDYNDIYTKKYSINVSVEYRRRLYSEEEKKYLRPIAETLAMLDGNAFFSIPPGNDIEWYEQYLPEAAAIFYSNGGKEGFAGDASWIKDLQHETPAIKLAYDSWHSLKVLSK